MTEFVDVTGVEVVEHFFIPLSDGTRLSARMWRGGNGDPVPAILEYVPYRKRGGLETRDEIMHRYVASHGYACVRVDIRGSGESDGLLVDEYLRAELDDGAEVVEWLAGQDWCSGAVGIIGKSWGGFNGLQIAALQPPSLEAVITVCSTDDRYADDIHHKGGTLLTENLGWGSTMFSYNSMPPDPDLVGESWRDTWMARLEANRPWILEWLQHQTRDDFYRHGSVCEDFSLIRAPVLAVGGWADSYTNALFRIVNGLETPVRALVGPWVHLYPHQGTPQPDVDFLGIAVRWWDHWLKGIDRGVMDEPLVRVFAQDSYPPAVDSPRRVGRWLGLDSWPPVRMTEWVLVDDGPVEVATPQSLGQEVGEFCPMWEGPDLPGDQSADDERSVCFERTVSEPVDLLGAPVLELDFACDRPGANLIARLCDVFPDGRSTRVSYMPLNLTHHAGDAVVEPLGPGDVYHVSIPLDDCAHRFTAGHTIRLALSTTYWPLVWPHPETATVTIHSARLLLPLSDGHREDRGSDLGHGVGARPDPTVLERPELHTRSHRREGATAIYEIEDDFGAERFASGLVRSTVARELYRIRDDDPLSASMEAVWEDGMSREGWSVRTVTETWMTSDLTHFHVEARLIAFEGDDQVFNRTWTESFLRVGT